MAAPTPLTEANTYYTTLSIGPYKRDSNFKFTTFSPTLVVRLPLPTELRDDTTVSYTNVNLETVGDFLDPNRRNQGMLDAAALRNIGALGQMGLSATSAGLGRLVGGRGALATIAGAAGGAFIGMVQSLVPAEQVTSAIQQQMGAAPNPNPSVQFQGPVLRDFTLSWAFYPKNEGESRNIDNLIKKLKGRALPANNKDNNGAVLNYPHLCQVNFYPWDSGGRADNNGWSDNSIIRVKKCFMAGVNVNYNAFGTPGFFEGTRLPISYQLTISFKEVEYLLAGDWDPEAAAESEANVARVTTDNVISEGAGIIFGVAGGVGRGLYNAAKESILNEYADQSAVDTQDNVVTTLDSLKPDDGNLAADDPQSRITIRTGDLGFFDALSAPFTDLDLRGPGLWTISRNAEGKYVVVFDQDDRPPDARTGLPTVYEPEVKGTFDTPDQVDAYLQEQEVYTYGTQTFPPRQEAAAAAPGE